MGINNGRHSGSTDYRTFRETRDALQEARNRVAAGRLLPANSGDLRTSAAGRQALTASELEVPGIYHDMVGIGTYGIGCVIHQMSVPAAGNGGTVALKVPSMLLNAALASEATRQRFVTTDLIKAPDGSRAAKVKFLSRSMYLQASAGHTDKLIEAATDVAIKFLATHSTPSQAAASTAAQSAAWRPKAETMVEVETALLALTPAVVFEQRLPKYERMVRNALGDTPLSQDEFDALVHLVFNTGSGPIGGTKKKWTGTHTLDSGARDKAAVEIERKIRAYCKVTKDGQKVVSSELSRRRASEANTILKRTREEGAALDALERLRERLSKPPGR